MARVEIPVTTITSSGVEPPAATVSDSTNDHYIATNNGDVFLEAVNVSGSSRTVTIITQAADVDGLVVPDRTITVPAGETRLIGPLKRSTHNVQSGVDVGQVYIDPSASTDLELRAYQLPFSS